jgi:gamma-glutamyltranspeptidase/glutathione hydrolase
MNNKFSVFVSKNMYTNSRLFAFVLIFTIILTIPVNFYAQRTAKPVLHGKHWMAITGKPLAATTGAMTFQKGGNAVDAACAMLAVTSTMWFVKK